MSAHLIGLNKCPGFRSVGVGETWQKKLAKFVLVVTGAEAEEACRKEEICSVLEAGIEGGIHALRLLWQQHTQEEDWGFLHTLALNAFNKKNHIAM